MLAIQLLVCNIIQELSRMTFLSDRVDEAEIIRPQETVRTRSVVKASLCLSAFTAVFYFLFFLYIGPDATPLTQASLFLFYNFTQMPVILSMRSPRPFFRPGIKPSRLLLGAVLFFIAFSAALVYTPFTAGLLGFAAPPLHTFAVVAGFGAAYFALLEGVKAGLGRRRQLGAW